MKLIIQNNLKTSLLFTVSIGGFSISNSGSSKEISRIRGADLYLLPQVYAHAYISPLPFVDICRFVDNENKVSDYVFFLLYSSTKWPGFASKHTDPVHNSTLKIRMGLFTLKKIILIPDDSKFSQHI